MHDPFARTNSAWTKHFWELAQEGKYESYTKDEETGEPLYVFSVSATDRELFPKLAPFQKVFIWCSTEGYVHVYEEG